MYLLFRRVIVSLDNRSFQTLEQWGIKLAAVPKNANAKEAVMLRMKM